MMEKYKILIVEDDVDLREGLSFSFSGDGYDVTETGTKKDGLQEIANGGYDIVFLDCNLPDGTGFELCKEVRSYSNIPIIMLTARDTEMDEIKALELGVNDYLLLSGKLNDVPSGRLFRADSGFLQMCQSL